MLTKQAFSGPNKPGAIASYLLPIVKALDSRGVDSASLLQQAGIEHAVSSDPMARLPYKQMGEVFRLAADATGDPRFGLYASRYMLPSHIHALGSAMLASRNLMDMCHRIERFGAFLAQTVVFYVTTGKTETALGAHLNVPLRPEAMDMFWSFIVRFMRHLYTEDYNPLRVDVAGPDTPDARLACELETGRYSLIEITYMLGFNDTSSFSRAFKRWSGRSPREFRQG